MLKSQAATEDSHLQVTYVPPIHIYSLIDKGESTNPAELFSCLQGYVVGDALGSRPSFVQMKRLKGKSSYR